MEGIETKVKEAIAILFKSGGTVNGVKIAKDEQGVGLHCYRVNDKLRIDIIGLYPLARAVQNEKN